MQLTSRHHLQRPLRQGHVLPQPTLIELQCGGHGIPQTDELVCILIDLADAHHTIAAQNLPRENGKVVNELSQPQHSRIRSQRLRRWAVTVASDSQRSSEGDRILLIQVQHPPPQTLAHRALA